MHLRTFVLALFIFSCSIIFSQRASGKIQLEFKEKELYRNTSGTPGIPDYSGYSTHGTSRSTHTFIYFSVGDGPQQLIGRKGKRLKEILKKDSAAYEHFVFYRRAMRKRNTFNGTRVLSEIVLVGGGLVFLATVGSANTAGKVISGAVAVAGITGGIMSVILQNKNCNKAIQELVQSVEIYNANLDKKEQLPQKE